MTVKKFLFAAAVGAGSLVAQHLAAPRLASAQSSTTGAVQGVVADSKTGEKLAGVTGHRHVAGPPGHADVDHRRERLLQDHEPAARQLPDHVLLRGHHGRALERECRRRGHDRRSSRRSNQAQAGGEVVKVTASAPTIDPTSTTQGITIDKNYIKNIPVPGRTFEAALGAAAGSQNDGVGVSFSGSSSLENQYYVDGVNTTGLTYGTVGSPVINDFIEEIEVITGGYNAEYGRATGGVVNVVTKSGSNEFKGSVFGYWQPGQLTAAAQATPIERRLRRSHRQHRLQRRLRLRARRSDHQGQALVLRRLRAAVRRHRLHAHHQEPHRLPQDQRRRHAVGVHPEDARPGWLRGRRPRRRSQDRLLHHRPARPGDRSATSRGYNILGKLNYAATPENQGQLTFQALPSSSTSPGLDGLKSAGYNQTDLTTDLSGKWTSKFNDNKTELEAVVGWHRDRVDIDSNDPMTENEPRQILRARRSRRVGSRVRRRVDGHEQRLPERRLDRQVPEHPELPDGYARVHHRRSRAACRATPSSASPRR